MMLTFEPKLEKIPANSSAIYPPPYIKISLGKVSNSKASSEVIKCLFPTI